MHKDVYPSNLSRDNLVKFSDIYDIIKFINPKAIYQATEDPVYSQRILGILKKSQDLSPWVTTRHKYFYEWHFLGWRQLPPDYPLNKNPSDKNKNNISNWVHKAISHDEYLAQDLFMKSKSNDLINMNLKRIDYYDEDETSVYSEDDERKPSTYSFVNEFGHRETQDINNPIYIQVNNEKISRTR